MKYKTIVAGVLWIFIAASLAVLVAKGLRPSPAASPDGPAAASQKGGPRLIVYYFHGKARCAACENIGAYAREVLRSGFGEQLARGDIQWQVVDYEESGNEHYKADYDLIAPSIVLVKPAGRADKRWKSLPEVWPLAGDKAAFTAYIQKEVRGFLETD